MTAQILGLASKLMLVVRISISCVVALAIFMWVFRLGVFGHSPPVFDRLLGFCVACAPLLPYAAVEIFYRMLRNHYSNALKQERPTDALVDRR